MDSLNIFVQKFHEKFNSMKYDEIYDSSASELKTKAEKAFFIKSMESIHKNLGEIKSTNLIGITPTKSDQGLSLTAAKFSTTYRDGTAEETFFLKPDGDQFILFQYNIDSADLMKKMINNQS